MNIKNPKGTFGTRSLVTSRGTSNATLDNKENQGESSGKQPESDSRITDPGKRASPGQSGKDKGWGNEGNSQR